MKRDKHKAVSQVISDSGVVERVNKADIIIIGTCILISLFLIVIGILALIQ